MYVYEMTGDVIGVMRACGNDVIAAHAVNCKSCRFPVSFECLLRIAVPFCVPIADCCRSSSSISYLGPFTTVICTSDRPIKPSDHHAGELSEEKTIWEHCAFHKRAQKSPIAVPQTSHPSNIPPFFL